MDDLSVLVLCGGKGERLRPLTDQVPKPLIEIGGKPILHYLISHFKKFGFKRFIIATGYKHDEMEKYFSANHQDLHVKLVNSGDADIIKRIQDSEKHIPGDFILVYGDTLADVNLQSMIDFHKSHKGALSITSYPLQSQFGILEVDDNDNVTSFKEKPVLDKWINIGYYYFENHFFKDIHNYNRFIDFLHYIIEISELYCFKHTGMHITVNTMKELAEAEENIQIFNEILRS